MMAPAGGDPVSPGRDSYQLGKGATVVVVSIVALLALSAILGGPGTERRGPIRLYVVLRPAERIEPYRPFRDLLSRKSGRTVQLDSGPLERAEGDLFIMDSISYFRSAKKRALRPVGVFRCSLREPERALLLADTAGAPHALVEASWSEIVFASPGSVNGFLVPFMGLLDMGLPPPSSYSGIRFAGSMGPAGPRGALLELISGGCPVAAASSGTLQWMEREGLISAARIRILAQWPALPERVVACNAVDSVYYASMVEGISRCFERGNCPHWESIIDLFRAYGVMGVRIPVAGEFESLRKLITRMDSLAAGHWGVSP